MLAADDREVRSEAPEDRLFVACDFCANLECFARVWQFVVLIVGVPCLSACITFSGHMVTYGMAETPASELSD